MSFIPLSHIVHVAGDDGLRPLVRGADLLHLVAPRMERRDIRVGMRDRMLRAEPASLFLASIVRASKKGAEVEVVG